MDGGGSRCGAWRRARRLVALSAVASGAALSCAGRDGETPRSPDPPASAREAAVAPSASTAAPAPAPAPAPETATQPPGHAAAVAVEDLAPCIAAVLRDPFPDGSVALDRNYREAATRYGTGDADEEKYFSEIASRFGSAAELQPLGHFGLAEVESRRADAFSRRSVVRRYDFVLRARTAHPLKEITVVRIAAAQLRLDDRAGAAAALHALDPSRPLGRCDREVRAETARLLREIASGPLEVSTCRQASALARALGDADTESTVDARCRDRQP